MSLGFPLTVRNVFDDLLLLVGVEIASNSPMYIRERLINDINATLQVMQVAGEDYFARETIAVTVPQGQSEVDLDSTVQTVIGPVQTADGYSLRELDTIGELDLFPQVYLGFSGLGATGTPLAYFVYPIRDNTGDGDALKIKLYFAPTADADYAINLDVVKVPPVFTYADLSDTTKLIPVIHKYAQSVFLPIARYNVMTCPWFRRQEMKESITADYHRALNILGFGAAPDRQGITDALKERKTQAARAAAKEAYNATV